MPQRQDIVVLQGGLDLVSPAMLIPPGACIAALNYEPDVVAGYRRCEGYERLDGRLEPSQSIYWTLDYTSGSQALVVGQTLVGGTSGATGVLVVAPVLVSGTVGAGTAAGTFVMHLVTGTFATGEALLVLGADAATAAGPSIAFGPTEQESVTAYNSAVAEARRAAIERPAGSGPIRGVATYKGVPHCWRNSADGTATRMFKATSAGWVVQGGAMPPGATVRAIEKNFYGSSGTSALYFTTGTGRAYEWDGATLTAIDTGLDDALDKPLHVAEYKNHLFLLYDTGSLLWSSIGDPTTFDTITGAGELGIGERGTGLRTHLDSLIIAGRNKLAFLTGSDESDFVLNTISESSGAAEGTLEVIGAPIFLDDQGVRDLQAAEAYGDWQLGTISRKVEPLLAAKRDRGVRPVGMLRVRAKDQGRLYFADGSGLIMYFGGESPALMTVQLGFMPTCFVSGEDSGGDEILLAGGADGFVYRLDAGLSHDGQPIRAFFRLSFLNQGAPNLEKRYHRARVEGQAGIRNSTLAMVADFSYGSDEQPSGVETAFPLYGDGGFWGETNWNEFTWNAPVEGQATADVDGMGESLSMAFMSDSATEWPHSLSTLTINWTPRRSIR